MTADAEADDAEKRGVEVCRAEDEVTEIVMGVAVGVADASTRACAGAVEDAIGDAGVGTREATAAVARGGLRSVCVVGERFGETGRIFGDMLNCLR